MSDINNILVIRNDKLGDFMLAWPAFSLLKKQYPQATITALLPAYTIPMAEICPWIDDCITDVQHNSTIPAALSLSKKIKNKNFDAAITLFSEFRTGLAVWLSGIPIRVAPATKLAQIFYNNKLPQRRSKSEKPEHAYNVDLVKYFVQLTAQTPCELQPPPYLSFNSSEITSIRENFKHKNNIDTARKLIFFHPGTGGSAINLTNEQYSEIANIISRSINCHIVITAGPDELTTAKKLSKLLPDAEHSIYHSTDGIVSFSKFLSIADLFISGSTGPLHIAGALNRPTAAFYPARRSATPLRWQTLNQEDRRLSFTPAKHIDDNDMKSIDPVSSAGAIIHFLSTQNSDDC